MSRFAGSCRFLVAVAVALVATGCGGSSSTTTTPPPTNTTPASVVVQAGDGQQAAPGAAVATSPTVLVTNSAGQPLSGVSVTFTVDSGGGSLSTTTTTTGANGIATAGTWTLGNSEGRNTLRVTVGSLPPVKIAATAVAAATSYPPVTVGAGGGSITVTQPGPLNGFSITIPAGAFPSGLTATISYASNSTLPHSSVIIPVSPLFTISTTTTGYATTPLTIHMPATIPAGDFPVIVINDPSSGAREVLTTVAWDANGVTAVTNTLSGTALVGASSLRVSPSWASLASPGATGYVGVLPPAVLMADYDSGYRPGVDDWEFPTAQTELTVTKDVVNTVGVAATSLWYYSNSGGSRPKLNGHFALQPGAPYSDRLGLRWSGVIGTANDVAAENAVKAELIARVAANNAAGWDQSQYLAIRSKFAASAENGGQPRPQLIEVQTANGSPFYLIVYRVSGTRLYVADPSFPGDASRFLEFAPGSEMTPYTTQLQIFNSTVSTVQYQVGRPTALGLSSMFPPDQFPTTYAQVLNGTIGQGQFPAYELHGWAGRLYDTLFVADTLRFWMECAACTYGYATSLSPAPANKIGGGLFVYLNPVQEGGALSRNGFLFSTSPPVGSEIPFGLVVGSAPTAQNATTGSVWLDWHTYVVRRLQTSIAPAVPVQTPGTPLSMTFQVAQNLLPPHVNYVWDFGDHQPAVTVADDPTVQHTYDALGNYPVTAKIIDVRNNQVIGKATTAAAATEKWSLVTFQQVSLTGDPAYPPASNESRTMSELRDSILARPAGATVQLFHGGVALPQGLHELGDFLVRADVNVTAPSMFLTFPRGQPAGGLLAEAVAATGAASSATLGTSPCGTGCYPVVFTNAITLGGTPGALSYAGKAANWVGPMPNSRPCNVVAPTPDPRGKSPITGYLEINATQGSSGMQGTITFVTPVVNQGGGTVCVWDTVTEIRRTFAFTAVPAP